MATNHHITTSEAARRLGWPAVTVRVIARRAGIGWLFCGRRHLHPSDLRLLRAWRKAHKPGRPARV